MAHNGDLDLPMTEPEDEEHKLSTVHKKPVPHFIYRHQQMIVTQPIVTNWIVLENLRKLALKNQVARLNGPRVPLTRHNIESHIFKLQRELI